MRHSRKLTRAANDLYLYKTNSMEAVDMRTALHQYIDAGDDRLIRMLYAIAKEYDEYEEEEFTEEEMKEFEERRDRRLRGESKVYSWEEAKEIILKKQALQ